MHSCSHSGGWWYCDKTSWVPPSCDGISQCTGPSLIRLFFPSLLLTQTSHPPPALLGPATRECGMSRENQEIGVEVHPEKAAPGAALGALTKVLHLGIHMTSSRHGGTSLTSPHGARGSLSFLHASRYVLDGLALLLFL